MCEAASDLFAIYWVIHKISEFLGFPRYLKDSGTGYHTTDEDWWEVARTEAKDGILCKALKTNLWKRIEGQ